MVRESCVWHAVCSSVLRVCCSVWQCVAVCCSVLQCVAVCAAWSVSHVCDMKWRIDTTHSYARHDLFMSNIIREKIDSLQLASASCRRTATHCNTLQHTTSTSLWVWLAQRGQDFLFAMKSLRETEKETERQRERDTESLRDFLGQKTRPLWILGNKDSQEALSFRSFSTKEPYNGSFAGRDLQLEASSASLPPFTR